MADPFRIRRWPADGRKPGDLIIVKDTERKQGVLSESAVLVGVELPNSEAAKDNLDEFAGLVETAGAEVVGRLTQKRYA